MMTMEMEVDYSAKALSTPQKLVRSHYRKSITRETISAPIPVAGPTQGAAEYSLFPPISPPPRTSSLGNELLISPKRDRDTDSLQEARKKAKTTPQQQQNAAEIQEYEDYEVYDNSPTKANRENIAGSTRQVLRPRKSRFIEGSMNNRASDKPRPELIGEYGMVMVDDGRENSGVERRRTGNVGANDKFTVGGLVSSVFTFKAVSYCKNAWWEPRKAKFEEMERKRREMEELKRMGEEKYQEIKMQRRQAALAALGDRMDLDERQPEEEIGRAFSTDEAVPAEFANPRSQVSSFHYSAFEEPLQISQSDSNLTGGTTKLKEKKSLKTRASRLFSHKSLSQLKLNILPDNQEKEKMISKKELARQQRLLKKYSNLEDKLQKTRLELAEAGIMPPPIPPLPAEIQARLSMSLDSVRASMHSTMSSTYLPDKENRRPGKTSSITIAQMDDASDLTHAKAAALLTPRASTSDYEFSLSSRPTSLTMPPPPLPKHGKDRGSVSSSLRSIRHKHVRSVSGGSSRHDGSPPPALANDEEPEVPVLSPGLVAH